MSPSIHHQHLDLALAIDRARRAQLAARGRAHRRAEEDPAQPELPGVWMPRLEFPRASRHATLDEIERGKSLRE